MNTYEPLQVYGYYHHGLHDIHNEWLHRINSNNSIVTNLHNYIDGYDFKLFYMPTKKNHQQAKQIKYNSKIISSLVGKLGKTQQHQFLLNELENEVYATNYIEGLCLKKSQIKSTIQNVCQKSKQYIYLKPFVKSYFKILNQQKLEIHKPQDIRDIYDHLEHGIISKDDLPDGKYFRKNEVRIGNAFSTSYLPKQHEKDFLPDISNWIKFINNDSISFIAKAFIAHYNYESIHAFYDGNGRLGRYMLCTYLSNKLEDPFTALSFSQAIKNHQGHYYKAFQLLNNPKNHGEITFFVGNMEWLLIRGQELVINQLKKIIKD